MELNCFHLSTVPAKVKDAPTNQTVKENNTVTFQCAASGNPPANIIWLKDEQIVGTGDTLSFLAFRNLSGRYQCSADNGLDVPANASAYLDVQCKYMLIFGTIYCVLALETSQ